MSDETMMRQVADSLVRCIRLLRRLGRGDDPVVEAAEQRLRALRAGDAQEVAVPGDLSQLGER